MRIQNKSIRNSKKKELNSITIYINRIQDEDIKNRIKHILDWYMRKATFYKNLFYMLNFNLILINASIPVINQCIFDYKELTVSIISAIATVITSCISLFTMKDTWFRYRKYVENIKQECILFHCHRGRYRQQHLENDLMESIELLISEERQAWGNSKFSNE